MNEQPFTAQVRSQPGTVVIDLSGEMNAFAQAALESAFEEGLRSRPERVVLNFTRVGYINSTGIALIVSLLARMRAANCAMAVYGLSDHYREIFQITRLSDFIGIFPDEASAASHPKVEA
jgi:anti-anti-sigma factor